MRLVLADSFDRPAPSPALVNCGKRSVSQRQVAKREHGWRQGTPNVDPQSNSQQTNRIQRQAVRTKTVVVTAPVVADKRGKRHNDKHKNTQTHRPTLKRINDEVLVKNARRDMSGNFRGDKWLPGTGKQDSNPAAVAPKMTILSAYLEAGIFPVNVVERINLGAVEPSRPT